MPHNIVYQGAVEEMFTSVADRSFCREILNLSTLMEGMVGDGELVKLKLAKFTSQIIAYGTDLKDLVLSASFFLVQYSPGSLSEISNSDNGIIDNIIDDACSDEFGHQSITPTKLLLYDEPASTTFHFSNIWNFELPQPILRILEKEMSTEREQSLSLVCIGFAKDAITDIKINTSIRVEMTKTIKPISIR